MMQVSICNDPWAVLAYYLKIRDNVSKDQTSSIYTGPWAALGLYLKIQDADRQDTINREFQPLFTHVEQQIEAAIELHARIHREHGPSFARPRF